MLTRWLTGLAVALRSAIRRKQVDADLDEELQYHLQRQIEEGCKSGLTAEEARYAAMRDMGGMTQHKEASRDVLGLNLVENAITDIRHGIRIVRKNSGFAAAVIATLAVGIGATTAVFSVVYGVLLRPLPYPKPAQLVTIGHDVRGSSVGVANFLDWRAQNTVFDDIAIVKNVQNFNITGDSAFRSACWAAVRPPAVPCARGATRAQAQMTRIRSGIGRIFPDIQPVATFVAPMHEQLVREVRTPLYFLMGAVSCLLLIGCEDLANLLVARSMSRAQELVVRAALGARKGR